MIQGAFRNLIFDPNNIYYRVRVDFALSNGCYQTQFFSAEDFVCFPTLKQPQPLPPNSEPPIFDR